MARLAIEREKLLADAAHHRNAGRSSGPDAQQLAGLDRMEETLGGALITLKKHETRFFMLADHAFALAKRGRVLQQEDRRAQVAKLDAEEAEANAAIDQHERGILEQRGRLLTIRVEKTGLLNQVQKLEPRQAVSVHVADVRTASRRPPRGILVRASSWAAHIDQLRTAGTTGPVEVLVNEITGEVLK